MFNFLSEKFSSLFSRISTSGKLTEKNIEEVVAQVEEALLDADVPYNAVREFSSQIQKEALGKKIFASLKPAEQFAKIVYDKLLYFLGGQSQETTFAFQIPSIIMVMGLQGSGKTTTVAKLAHYIVEQAKKRGKNRRVLVASVDFYRPAAVEQLAIMAQKAQVDFYVSSKTNPVDAALDIAEYSRKNQYELLILDTAGRLHVDHALLEELKKIDELLRPKYTFLVLDAMIGQESLAVAQAFDKGVGFTGGILTKLDSETRGGVAFAFKYVIAKPLLFIGNGEKIENFELFRPERLAGRILGMGDVASLMEKAEEKIKHSEQEKSYKSIMSGKMNLRDFADQMSMVSRLGSLSELMRYLPGAAQLKLTPDKIAQGEVEMKKCRAIISSMTKKEQMFCSILDASRKKRIAAGAGVTVADIDSLISRFEQSQQFIKQFKKMGRF